MRTNYTWRVSRSPKAAQLNSVEAAGGTAYAAGNRGMLLERQGWGDWRPVFRTGVTGNGQGLNGVSVTDDGHRAWFAGTSGALGFYDRRDGSVEPHVRPADLTSNFTSIVAKGRAGSEQLLVATDNGRALTAHADGVGLTVGGTVKPGDGTTFTEAVEIDETVYLGDGSGVIHCSPNGQQWQRRRLAETTVTGLASAGSGLAAVTDSQSVHTDIPYFDQRGTRKQLRSVIGSPQDLAAEGETFVVVGGGGGLATFEGQAPFEVRETGVDKSFHGADIAPDGRILAVGSEGYVVEGRPDGQPDGRA